jgi:thiol:disulfide interchange protein
MKIFFKLIFLLYCGSFFGQNEVVWTATYKADSALIVIEAAIAKDWHLYSINLSPDAGPVPTSFVFPQNGMIHLHGGVLESKPETHFDPNFEANISSFEHHASFRQQAHKEKSGEYEIIVTYMVCNNLMCLPPKDQVIKVNL